MLSSLRHPCSLAPFRCLRDPVILTNLDTILFSGSTQHRYPYKAFRHVSVIPSVFPSFSILQSVFTLQPATSLKIARIFPISLMERIVNLYAEKKQLRVQFAILRLYSFFFLHSIHSAGFKILIIF